MWKNWKSYFIVEEENAKTAPRKSSIPDKRTAKPAGSTSEASSTSGELISGKTASVGGKVADKFVDILLQAMESANLPGFDYLEYKKSLQNLEKMNFDDAMRFQTAYAAAQSMGVTPRQLVESAGHYLKTLEQEQKKFSQALAKQQTDQIAKKQEQLKRLEQRIVEQEAQIKELQTKISQTKQQQTKLNADIQKNSGKISATKADFEKTYDTIAGNIRRDIDKMKEYLK